MKKYYIFIVFLLTITLLSKELEKVSLQFNWKYQFEFAGFIAAKEKGFYEEVGLDVELRELKDGVDIINDVMTGKSTYGISNSNILLSYLKGKKIKLIASFFKRSAMVLVVKPEVNSPNDLIGKKIMADELETFNLLFRNMFQSQNIDTNDLILVKHTYNINDFANGKVDAISSFISDEPYKLNKLGVKYNILDPSDYGIYNLFMELFASEKEVRRYPKRTDDFKNASIKGWEYALSHKKEIIDIIHKKYRPDIPFELLENEAMKIEKLILPYAYEVGSINKSFLNKQKKLMMKYYDIIKDKPIEEFIFNIHKKNDNLDRDLLSKFFLAGLVILLFLLYRQKQLKKHNKNLEIMNQKLSLKKIELSNQIQRNKQLTETLEKKIKEEVEKNRDRDKQMIQQSRLAQMGEMISMIAHQWRQPLSAISNTSNSLNIKAQLNKLNNDLVIEHTNKINSYTQHLSSTIDDFRNFFKPNKEKQKTNYDEIIDSVLSIIETSVINKNIKIVKKLNSKSFFMTYKNEVKQVVLNLIKNAEDILLEKKIKDPVISIITKDEHKNYILEISDNAGGIPEYIIDKIFDPYFSTKDAKNGTGLGLYMSKVIIEDHCGGKITVKNKIIDEDSNRDENEYFMIKGFSNTAAVFKIILK